MWFDSNAVEMTTVKHCMYLTKFCELLACQYSVLLFWRIQIYVWNQHVCLIRQEDEDKESKRTPSTIRGGQLFQSVLPGDKLMN